MKPLLYIALLSSLIACGANKPAPTNSSISDEATSGWFCQVGLSDELWECVQDAALAAAPKPTRLPKAKPAGTAEIPPTPSVETQGNAAPPSTAAITAAAPPPSLVSPTSNKPATLNPVAAQPAAAQPMIELPRHVELSYRPEVPVALLDLPAEFFAVQLLAVSSKATLEAFAKQHNIRGMSAARTWNGHKLFYILLLGIYETEANARASIESLAPPFDKMNPWIRDVGSLQQAILAADRETGSTEF